MLAPGDAYLGVRITGHAQIGIKIGSRKISGIHDNRGRTRWSSRRCSHKGIWHNEVKEVIHQPVINIPGLNDIVGKPLVNRRNRHHAWIPGPIISVYGRLTIHSISLRKLHDGHRIVRFNVGRAGKQRLIKLPLVEARNQSAIDVDISPILRSDNFEKVAVQTALEGHCSKALSPISRRKHFFKNIIAGIDIGVRDKSFKMSGKYGYRFGWIARAYRSAG